MHLSINPGIDPVEPISKNPKENQRNLKRNPGGPLAHGLEHFVFFCVCNVSVAWVFVLPGLVVCVRACVC